MKTSRASGNQASDWEDGNKSFASDVRRFRW